MKRVAKFQEGGEVTPPFVRRRQAREEAARAAEAEGDGRGAMQERFRNFFRRRPPTQEEADILEAYRTNRDVREIRREREAGGRAAAPAPAPAPAPAAPAPATPSQVQPPPRPAPAMPAPTADYEERMRRGSLPAGRSAAPGSMGDYSERAAAGAAARPRPAQRPAPRPRYSEADIARIRSVMEGGDIQPEQPGFFERLGLRRTNETGMEPGTVEQRRNYLGSGAADTNVSYNKKGGLLKAKAPMKKGGKAMMYREGGKVRQGMQSPKAQEARAEMAEDVMRRERARDPISDKERKAGRAEAAMDSGPLTDAEKERMRASGFKKGGMVKPMKYQEGGSVEETAPSRRSNRSLIERTAEAVRRNPVLGPIARGAGALRRATLPKKAEELERRSRRGVPSDIESGPQDPFTLPPGLYINPNQEEEIVNIKKGGMVKAKAPAKKMKSGGKVAPKKMMKGGMTSKPKKMMGGGRAMYAKGGMARGCK